MRHTETRIEMGAILAPIRSRSVTEDERRAGGWARLNLRIRADQLARIRRAADAAGMTPAAWVTRVVSRDLGEP